MPQIATHAFFVLVLSALCIHLAMRHHFQLRYAGFVITRSHVWNRFFLRPVPVFHLTNSWMSLLSLAAVAFAHPCRRPSTAMYPFNIWLVLSPFFTCQAIVPAFSSTSHRHYRLPPSNSLRLCCHQYSPFLVITHRHEQRTGGVYMHPRDRLLQGCI